MLRIFMVLQEDIQFGEKAKTLLAKNFHHKITPFGEKKSLILHKFAHSRYFHNIFYHNFKIYFRQFDLRQTNLESMVMFYCLFLPMYVNTFLSS